MRIPVIWLCLCAAAALAADPARPKRDILRLGPKPPVERFPPQPYVAPPTPEEVAADKAAAEARLAARLAHRAAVSNLLVSVGVSAEPTRDPEKIAARAKVISNIAAAVKMDSALASAVTEAAVAEKK